MAFKKGQSGNPSGKKKGTKNKLPRDLKNRILEVWDKLEKSKKGLYKEAENDPKWFYEHFIKPMLPKDVKLGADGPLRFKVTYDDAKPSPEED